MPTSNACEPSNAAPPPTATGDSQSVRRSRPGTRHDQGYRRRAQGRPRLAWSSPSATSISASAKIKSCSRDWARTPKRAPTTSRAVYDFNVAIGASQQGRWDRTDEAEVLIATLACFTQGAPAQGSARRVRPKGPPEAGISQPLPTCPGERLGERGSCDVTSYMRVPVI